MDQHSRPTNTGTVSGSLPSKNAKLRRVARRAFAILLISTFSGGAIQAQPPRKPAGQQGAKGTTSTNKLSEKEKKAERARELYADAAVAQNNFAFDLAIENWNKMLKEFPDDELASSAHHFLGMCYIQQEMPDFKAAIDQFRTALKDTNLKQREEALGNLGWSLYQKSMIDNGNEKSEMLVEAAKVLATVIEKYPDGSTLDKALLHAAEAESRLGNKQRALTLYKQLVQNKRLENSSVRPDAIFGMGLTYEEMEQPKLARENYEQFLASYANHPFAGDVRLRFAEIALASDDAKQAVQLLEQLVKGKDFDKTSNADYVLYRYGFALAKAGKFDESAAVYKKLSDQFPKSQYSKNSSLAAGQALMREKKYDDAIRSFEGLLSIKDDRSVEAAHWICQIKLLQSKPQEVITIARNALEWAGKSPMTSALKMDLADGLSSIPAQRGEAKKVYEQLATDYPNDPIAPRATYNAAFTSLQVGSLADAQRWSETFFKRFSNDPLAADVAYVRAESTLQLGQHESAVVAFEQLIASQPNDPLKSTWQLRLAAALNLSGQHDKNVKVCEGLLSQVLEPAMKAEALYLKGLSLFKLSKVNEAIDALQKSLAASNSWAQADEAAIQLGEAYVSAGKSKEAIATMESALKTFPKSRLKNQAQLRMAQLAADANDFKKATQAYDEILASSENSSQLNYARFGKAFILVQQGMYEKALELLNPVCDSKENDFLVLEAKIAKAICLRKTKAVNEAIALLQSIEGSAQGVQKANVLYELGFSYVAADQNEKAIGVFESLIGTAKDFALLDEVLFELAFAHKAVGNSEKAIAKFQELIEKFPKSKNVAEASFQIGQAEYDSSKFDRAIKAYTVAATVKGAVQEKSLYKLGWSFYQQSDLTSAEDQFRKQLREFPEGQLADDGKFMIAECLLKKEDFDGAFREYSALRLKLEKTPTNVSLSEPVQALIYLHAAQSASKLKKWADAESLASTLLTKFADSKYKPFAIYELAYAKQKQKKAKEAIELYSEVADNYREEIGAHARFMIGEVLFTEGNHAKAISEFQKVMYGYGGTQAPDDIKGWQALSAWEAGRCSEVIIADLTGESRNKAVAAARKFYDFVVNNHPNHDIAAKAKQRLAELTSK